MIDICPDISPHAARPLVVVSEDGARIVALFDGAGSWGAGMEAARWCRDRVEAATAGERHLRLSTLVDALNAAVDELPPHIRDEAFGWSFSFAAVSIRDTTLHFAAAGVLAIFHAGDAAIHPLYAPVRLIDQLVASGKCTREEARAANLDQIVAGPILGDPGMSLIISGPVTVTNTDRIWIGDRALLDLSFHAPDRAPDHKMSAQAVQQCAVQLGGRRGATVVLGPKC